MTDCKDYDEKECGWCEEAGGTQVLGCYKPLISKTASGSKVPCSDGVIKPCPFCGNKKVDIMGTDIPGDINIVTCANPKCGAEIGKLTESEAIEAWQKRAL